MTFEEALEYVKKHASWRTERIGPNGRYARIIINCKFVHGDSTIESTYPLYDGYLKYRPEVMTGIIDGLQRHVANFFATEDV